MDRFVYKRYLQTNIDKKYKLLSKGKRIELYGWCFMTSHIHLLVGTKGNPLSNIMRDLKRHTSEKLHIAISTNKTESRRKWMLWMMGRAAHKNTNKATFQLWQAESHPVELTNNIIAHQKLAYAHYNPVEAGFVKNTEDCLYSSAIDYNGGKGLLEIIYLDTLMK